MQKTNLDYEKPEVQLSGEDGNVFSIIARCGKALRRVCPAAEVEFRDKAFAAGSYDEVLRLAMKYCEVK